jgi:hypothetical protein
MKTHRFTFPVVSFRNLETPFSNKGYRDYFAVVALDNLPDLSDWREINVRDPKLTGAVPEAIRESVSGNPELFVFLNRGIVLSVDSVSFDNKKDELTITMKNPHLHGLLDGGHTYNIVRAENENLEFDQYVRLEILEGFEEDEIPALVDARNTSNQVKDQSLMNLQGEFDLLKAALRGKPYFEKIAFKEYETNDEGDPKPIDVREIIAILTVFDRDNFDKSVHPINAYRSKAACLKHFEQHKASYRKIYPVADDVLRLYDAIQLHLPSLYNKARGDAGDVAGGKFGKLTGVTTYKGHRGVRLHFLGKDSKYGVPSGFVYPLLGAFRALLKEKHGKYTWARDVDPFKLLEGDLGTNLADTIGTFALDARNPSKTGKSPLVWQACYRSGQVAYLETRAEGIQ